MVMASGTNKWASRAVVILQLAAWSAVGIVLLQKGVSSLQKRPTETRNITQVIPIKSIGTYRQEDQRNLLVIPIDSEKNSNRHENKLGVVLDNLWNDGIRDAEFLNDQQSLDIDKQNFHSNTRHSNEDVDNETKIMENIEAIVKNEFTKEDLIGKKFYPSKKTVKTKLETMNENKDIDEFNITSNNSKELLLPIKLINEKILSSLNVDIEENQRQLTKTEKIPLSENSQPNINSNQTFGNTNNENKTTPIPLITTKLSNNWETRRRLRLSHLSGGGAAAAVAMVTVGAVMLVLGPAVIVLRALDERRQERRFLKLSGRDDLPPSYEQATLMDEAPRYSSLSLNTILGPPPPPSPTPARVHIV